MKAESEVELIATGSFHICIVFTWTDTLPVQKLNLLTCLCALTQIGPDSQADGETSADCCVHTEAAICVYTRVR